MKKYFLITILSAIAFVGCSSYDAEILEEFEGGNPYFSNIIHYTSTNGKIVKPTFENAFGVAKIIDNSYTYGHGIITFDKSVTSIGENAFLFCDALESIVIPNSVTEIGGQAFFDCVALKSIVIPDSVTKIGNYSFSGCSSLKSITIPNGVTSIGEGAFNYCRSLTSIIIPNSVTSIRHETFNGCTSLQAFYGKFASADNRCLIVDGVLNSFAPAGLTEYTIPNSVAKIGSYAFRSCTSLTRVTIPDSVTEIGDLAFYYCYNLTSVYCKATTPPTLDTWVFDNNASGRKIYVPRSSVDAYKLASGWRNYASSIVGYDF